MQETELRSCAIIAFRKRHENILRVVTFGFFFFFLNIQLYQIRDLNLLQNSSQFHLYPMFSKRDYFQSSFRVTTILSRIFHRFPIYLLPPSMHSLYHYQHPPPESMYVTNDEPILAHHYHPRSTVYISIHSWCCTFYVFGQILVTL